MEPGQLLSGRFRLTEVIGRGSQSCVYRARDELLDRDVALKMFRNRRGDPEQVRRECEEVRILAGMSHHALVTLLDAGVDLSDEEDKPSYLVMELVHGPDLRQRLEQGPLSPSHLALIGHDLADGLSYMHHHGILHRDIKPANVLLVDYRSDDHRPRAKLADFGVAEIMGHRDGAEHTGGSTGTPRYLSPEQAGGDPAGPASDVYSLGLVFLEALTGTAAYPGSPIQSAVARLLRDPHIPRHLGPEWVALLTSMLDRDPAARPGAREVALTLRQETISGSGRHRDGGAGALTEEGRMQAVHRYRILDTLPDGTFDRVTAVAARVFSTPVAIVSVVDHDRIWFKSHHGTDTEQIGRDPGLCASAILQNDAWVIPDASLDPRTLANPLVAGEFGLKFYAGYPLRTPDGYNLGTLCVLDTEPREFSETDARTLEDLAAIVMNDLELRLQTRLSVSPAPDAVMSPR